MWNSCKNLTYDWGLQGLNWFLTQKNKCISLFRRFKPWYRTMGKINIWSMGAPLFETFAHLKLLYICSFGLLVGVQGLKNSLSQRRGSLKQKKKTFLEYSLKSVIWDQIWSTWSPLCLTIAPLRLALLSPLHFFCPTDLSPKGEILPYKEGAPGRDVTGFDCMKMNQMWYQICGAKQKRTLL